MDDLNIYAMLAKMLRISCGLFYHLHATVYIGIHQPHKILYKM